MVLLKTHVGQSFCNLLCCSAIFSATIVWSRIH